VLEVLREPMFLLLLAGGLVYLLLGDLTEALILLIFASASVGIKTNVKVTRSRRETKVAFVFKGSLEETEANLQKIYKALTG